MERDFEKEKMYFDVLKAVLEKCVENSKEKNSTNFEKTIDKTLNK